MRSLTSPRRLSVYLGALMAVALVIGSTATADAKRPPKPSPTPAPTPSPTAPPPSGLATIEIAPTGTLEPNRQYANVDVTVTCPTGWTWSNGWIYVLRGNLGGSGTFSASCTGSPQVAHSRVVNGNKYELGDWTATAYVRLGRNGQEATSQSSRTIRLVPGVTARVADQGQLIGTSGGGARLALAVACPTGATGQSSFVSVSQDGTAQGSASFTPVCDSQSHTVVLSMTSSSGPFHTGSAVGHASVTVTWNGEGFYGLDNRAITLLESSTGDTTPPTTPVGLSASTFGDTETWLTWGASSDNATPTGLIVYEVYLNGRFDQAIGGGYTQAILYVDAGVLNTIEVFAVDGAGNRSAPATVTVDMR
jgi:hypothetical protein